MEWVQFSKKWGNFQNATHNGPIFLPWHHHYMLILKQCLQTILDDDFGVASP